MDIYSPTLSVAMVTVGEAALAPLWARIAVRATTAAARVRLFGAARFGALAVLG